VLVAMQYPAPAGKMGVDDINVFAHNAVVKGYMLNIRKINVRIADLSLNGWVN